jgi:N utilization substance protein A
MESEITRLVTQLARIRNVEISYVYDTLEQSIIAGLKRRFGRDVRHEVKVDSETGKIEVIIIQTAVKHVQDVSLEISLQEAQKLQPDVKEGEDVRIYIPLEEVGRVTIQRTVDELSHRLREAERTKLFNEFIKKKGEIISGTIHKIEKEEILVNLGPIYGILPLRDQLKTDHHQIGAPFKFFVLRIQRTPIGPRVFLSRTHPEFLKRMLAQEVPEIQQNIVEIKTVARIPGVRSKVAVTSYDEKIDPIGACVGYRKVRIQNVTKELSGEKIDVIQWNPDHKLFIARAMSPARVNEVIEENETFTVVVPDDEFSKAIGRKGQNVWLASLLTNSKLDILKDSDYRNRLFSKRMAQIMVETLDFLAEETRKTLLEAGFTTVASIFEQPSTEAAKVLGWEPTRVEQLKIQIREQLERQELEKKLFTKKKLDKMRAAADDKAKELAKAEKESEDSAEPADSGEAGLPEETGKPKKATKPKKTKAAKKEAKPEEPAGDDIPTEEGEESKEEQPEQKPAETEPAAGEKPTPAEKQKPAEEGASGAPRGAHPETKKIKEPEESGESEGAVEVVEPEDEAAREDK